MKLIFFSSFSFVAAMVLVVSYPHFPSSSVNQITAFSNVGQVTFSFVRGILKGLGSGGGSLEASTADHPPPPRSGPISVPDFSTCQPGNFPSRMKQINCCPPVNTIPAVDFTPPPARSSDLRVRRALHLLDDEYMAKFTRAVQLMRELPGDDPRNFIQQANVHCAYCGGGHAHVGFPEKLLDIHGSWLFFPWHRMYIYFFERILGKLINDPTFALPYWNWDTPEGMHIPESFSDQNSTLYHGLRDEKHQHPATLDLNYDFITDSTASDQQLKTDNLAVIYRQVVSAGTTAELFYGKPYHAGDEPIPGRGSAEQVPHGMIHKWIGDRHQPKYESMGADYSAARDPLFFVHHSNVDRIWTIWKNLTGGNMKGFTDPDWLNTEFLFYNEEARLVKIKVKDCLDPAMLGYTFDDAGVAPLWVNARPSPRDSSRDSKKIRKISTTNPVIPTKLDNVVRFVVPRAAMNQNKKEEVLLIQGIKVHGDQDIVKFDVIINDDGNEDGIGPANTEFAGSYWSHWSSEDDKRVDSLRLGGISELLVGLGAQHDESVVVALVPRYDPLAGTFVTIGGVKFDYV